MEAVKKNFLYDEVLPRIERLSWLVAGVGLLFRYCLLRGSDTMLTVSLGTLATVYFLRAFEPVAEPHETELTLNFNYEPVSTTPSLLQNFQGIASAITLIGVLFKLLFWQGSALLLLVSVPPLLAVVALRLANGNLNWQTALIAGLGTATWATPTEAIVRQFYRDDPALIEKMLYQDQHPDDRAAAAEVVRLLQVRCSPRPR